jgi:hypothetical protein
MMEENTKRWTAHWKAEVIQGKTSIRGLDMPVPLPDRSLLTP